MFKEICEKAGIEQVYIFGKDMNLNNKLYDGIDIFIVTSLKEAVFMEAACCGIPVIMANSKSINIKSIKTFDTVDEAVALIQELSDIQVLKTYIEKLSEEIRNEWNWKTVCEKYWKPVFEKLKK
jgi:glycosyltransferase involved in cell wall biosynthesis